MISCQAVSIFNQTLYVCAAVPFFCCHVYIKALPKEKQAWFQYGCYHSNSIRGVHSCNVIAINTAVHDRLTHQVFAKPKPRKSFYLSSWAAPAGTFGKSTLSIPAHREDYIVFWKHGTAPILSLAFRSCGWSASVSRVHPAAGSKPSAVSCRPVSSVPPQHHRLWSEASEWQDENKIQQKY